MIKVQMQPLEQVGLILPDGEEIVLRLGILGLNKITLEIEASDGVEITVPVDEAGRSD